MKNILKLSISGIIQKGFISFLFLLIIFAFGCSKDEPKEQIELFQITFDVRGGDPTPDIQKILAGEFATEPEINPTKVDSVFIGWYTASDMKFNFASRAVLANQTLYAKWWGSPDQYIIINDGDSFYNYKTIKDVFGSSKGKSVAIGAGFILYPFERPAATSRTKLKEHLRQSEEFEIPVLVQFDPITFMTARPDLWNWWDPSQPGYNPNNKNNVEWSGWSPDEAVKIGWLNWGSQIRLKPMPNLESTAYKQAVSEEMTDLVTIVAEWYNNLPNDKRYLFAGIKVTGETAIGINNWYYPNGNSYIDKDPANDPKSGIDGNIKPSRGVQTIGYAALKTAGIKNSGNITGNDILNIASRYVSFVSKLAADLGIPRDHIFAHSGGKGDDMKSCINSYSCPAWSFYNKDAYNPSGFAEALNILNTSDASYFGIAEWAIAQNSTPVQWTSSISQGLSIPRCRFLSVYTNVIGNDYYKRQPNASAIEGIKAAQY